MLFAQSNHIFSTLACGTFPPTGEGRAKRWTVSIYAFPPTSVRFEKGSCEFIHPSRRKGSVVRETISMLTRCVPIHTQALRKSVSLEGGLVGWLVCCCYERQHPCLLFEECSTNISPAVDIGRIVMSAFSSLVSFCKENKHKFSESLQKFPPPARGRGECFDSN